MGIAESISAVGIAGTVTGLSYTQATAQQKEDEEEARRAAEAAQAKAAAASAATNAGRNNRNKQRSGADESGPSHGAFPVSGNLGGGRRRSRGPVQNGDNSAGKQDNDRAVAKGRGAGGKRQATAGQSKRSGDTTRRKGNQHQPPVAADSDVPTSDVPEPPASTGPIPTPGKGRRGGGKKRKAPNTDVHVVPEGGSVTVAPDIEYTVPNQHQETNLVADPPARQSDKPSPASPNSSREFLPSSSTQGPPSPNTSHPSHQPPGSQTTRQVSRARNRNRKTRTQSRGSTINTTPKPQPLQAASSPGPSHAQPTAQSPVDNVPPTPKSSRNDARRRGRGGGRGPQFAHIERSSPLASCSQSNA
ncbi:hypothetical protein FB446DRAFT_285544 [Lentinula raphanica]|nr:hypothetical protein FB446DRAFT_285544 [Lentinula raphanica]